jgi:hypothetical protein
MMPPASPLETPAIRSCRFSDTPVYETRDLHVVCLYPVYTRKHVMIKTG